MAGAGYKLFTTGSVLTAAEVNTYLQEQTVMVFADAAARTTALSGVVSEGMISYLKDTNAVEVYDGSNWVSSDDPNAIQNTIVDAKGDLITATAADTPSRLAVGNSGDTLVADSSATTGLRWQGNYSAGKNALINGDFRINQRAFSSTTTSTTYGFDRWKMLGQGGTVTYSAQTFTPGTAPVSGYEGINFARLVTASQSANNSYAYIRQDVEDVRTFAGQTITVSFWAKASTGTPKVGVSIEQTFGSGGSSYVATSTTPVTISASWARYSVVVAVPSVSGKTIGAGNYVSIGLMTSVGTDISSAGYPAVGVQNVTIDFWGIQAEAGSVATAFQTATGTLAGELAACQRYYVRFTDSVANGTIGFGMAISTTAARINVMHPVTMRTAPTSIDYSSLRLDDGVSGFTSGTPTLETTYATTDKVSRIGWNSTSGLTQYRPYFLSQNASNGYLGISAEL